MSSASWTITPPKDRTLFYNTDSELAKATGVVGRIVLVSINPAMNCKSVCAVLHREREFS